VQTDGGPAVGTVVAASRSSTTSAGRGRFAAARRASGVARRCDRAAEAPAPRAGGHRIALLKIRERGLGMKLTRVEQAFDGSKLIFYFTADGRVDFRELVRELARSSGRASRCGRSASATKRRCRRLRHLRPPAVLHDVPADVRAGVDQDGEAAGPEPQSLEAVGLCGALKCCLRYELPNAKGVQHGGCGSEGGCDNPSGCGSGGCGSAAAALRLRKLRHTRASMKPRSRDHVRRSRGIGPEVARAPAATRGARGVRAGRLRPPDARDFEPGVLSADAGRAAYDIIVRAVTMRARRRAGDRDRARQQGGVPPRGSAVERPHRSARAPHRRAHVAMMFHSERCAWCWRPSRRAGGCAARC
jgi:hypothetical protein